MSCDSKEVQKQNVVFILVDDLGWNDLGYSGSTFHETPNIDAFSKESIQFTNAYASSPVCSPTRAAIMTGKHPTRVNITDWIPGLDLQDQKLLGPKDLDQLPLQENTLAESFKKNGYSTFFAGKWHLGDTGFFPEDQGFDINIGGHHKGQPPGGYYSPYNNPKLKDGPEGEYLTDRLTNESINYIDTVKDKPFFLFLAYYTVHTPIQANKKHISKFNEKLKKIDTTEIFLKEEGIGITTLQQRNPEYASMLYSLDENIGRLIKKLKDEGLYDNTTIIFTSDNGGLTTNLKSYNSIAPTALLPLRAGKGWLYEGGIRIPLLIKPSYYSGKAKIIDEPVVSHDLYPTLHTVTGIKIDNSEEIDGVDFSPLLSSGSNLNRNEMYWYYPHYHGSGWTPGAAIRQGKWKLIEFYETGKVELYDLSIDISEKNDVSQVYPDKTIELKKRLKELLKRHNAQPATVNNTLIKK
jgi:arylsulfatase A-like enzyme